MILPTPHVWHYHDGSPVCPVPVGTVVPVTRGRFRSGRWEYPAKEAGWRHVNRFYVHSYPGKPV